MSRFRIVVLLLVLAGMGAILWRRGGAETGSSDGSTHAMSAGKSQEREVAAERKGMVDLHASSDVLDSKVTRAEVKAFLDAKGWTSANIYLVRDIFDFADLVRSSHPAAFHSSDLKEKEFAYQAFYRTAGARSSGAFADLWEMRALSYRLDTDYDAAAVGKELLRLTKKHNETSQMATENGPREQAIIDFWQFKTGDLRESWCIAMAEGYMTATTSSHESMADENLARLLAQAVMNETDPERQAEAAEAAFHFADIVAEGDPWRRNGGLGALLEMSLVKTLPPALIEELSGMSSQDYLVHMEEQKMGRGQRDQLFLAALKMATPEQIEKMNDVHRQLGMLGAQHELMMTVGIGFPWMPADSSLPWSGWRSGK